MSTTTPTTTTPTTTPTIPTPTIPTYSPLQAATVTAALDPQRDGATAAERAPLHRSAWTWAGLVAGVAGALGTLVLNAAVPTEEQTDAGVEAVYQTLDDQGAVRLGASLGFLAAYALVVFAVGFSRHVARRSPADSSLPAIVKLGLTTGVGTLIIGFGLKAAAAGGMPGGIDESFYTHTDSTVISTIAGQMQWVGWQGVAIAMAAVAVGAFRHRVVPRWVGAVAGLFSTFVVVFTLALALPYSAGIVAPIFLVLLSISLLATKAHR
jgi:hypothetical protein